MQLFKSNGCLRGMIMGMMERDLGITVFRSRVESLRGNTSEFPIREIHIERLPDVLDIIYVSFIVDLFCRPDLCKLIRLLDQRLQCLGIEACPKRDDTIDLYAPKSLKGSEGIRVCPMICASPGMYAKDADMADFLTKVGAQFGTHRMGVPQVVDDTPIDSILIRVMRSRAVRRAA